MQRLAIAAILLTSGAPVLDAQARPAGAAAPPTHVDWRVAPSAVDLAFDLPTEARAALHGQVWADGIGGGDTSLRDDDGLVPPAHEWVVY